MFAPFTLTRMQSGAGGNGHAWSGVLCLHLNIVPNHSSKYCFKEDPGNLTLWNSFHKINNNDTMFPTTAATSLTTPPPPSCKNMEKELAACCNLDLYHVSNIPSYAKVDHDIY
jgi:hypothetical protein